MSPGAERRGSERARFATKSGEIRTVRCWDELYGPQLRSTSTAAHNPRFAIFYNAVPGTFGQQFYECEALWDADANADTAPPMLNDRLEHRAWLKGMAYGIFPDFDSVELVHGLPFRTVAIPPIPQCGEVPEWERRA
eukprot:5979086-Pyramimonas_sp.AAC.1